MAHRLTIYPVHRMVYAKMSGALTGADFLAARAELVARPEFDPAFNMVLDLRGADLTGLTSGFLRNLATSSMFAQQSRRAFLVNSRSQYGLGRMYQTQRELAGGGDTTAIFEQLTDALAWLGLEHVPVERLERDQ